MNQIVFIETPRLILRTATEKDLEAVAMSWELGKRVLSQEEAQAVIDYGFGELDLARIDSGAASDNLASKRIMEKIGMRYVGTDADGGYLFTLTKEAYFQRA